MPWGGRQGKLSGIECKGAAYGCLLFELNNERTASRAQGMGINAIAIRLHVGNRLIMQELKCE